MISYLISSGLCLCGLLLFYHLVLEKEGMHRFNRFYLLGGLLFSLCIPFFSLNIAIPDLRLDDLVTKPYSLPTELSGLPNEQQMDTTIRTDEQSTFSPLQIVLGIYGAITLLLIIRFLSGLVQVLKLRMDSQTVSFQEALLVLSDSIGEPFTFLKYIFLNTRSYLKNEVSEDILQHEMVHVQEKHSWDILFLELLKTLLWFNPIIHMYQRAIKTNHEYQADALVLQHAASKSEYTKLLLQLSVRREHHPAVSSFGANQIKKRIEMITGKRKTRSRTIRKLLVIPVILGSVFLYCDRAPVQDNSSNLDDKQVAIQVTTKKTDNSSAIITVGQSREAVISLLILDSKGNVIDKLMEDKHDKGFFTVLYFKDDQMMSELRYKLFADEKMISSGSLIEAREFEDPGIEGMAIPELFLSSDFDEIIKKKKLLTGDLKLTGDLNAQEAADNAKSTSKVKLLKASAAYKIITSQYLKMHPKNNSMKEFQEAFSKVKDAGQAYYDATVEFYGLNSSLPAPPPPPLPPVPELRFKLLSQTDIPDH